MPVFEDGARRIHYEVVGEGFPVLTIAPGGLRSVAARWETAPYRPAERLGDRYRVIAMDQRNAGSSFAPIAADEGWDRYTGDQLDLLDHLGVDRFAVMGMCIGGAYVAGLLRAAPDRAVAGVMLQPIGLEDNREAFHELFDGWVAEIRDRHPEADAAFWAAFRARMFGGPFLFNATEEQVGQIEQPLLVLRGDDLYHPSSVSRRVAELAPRATLVERWKEGADLEAAAATVAAFLAEHAR